MAVILKSQFLMYNPLFSTQVSPSQAPMVSNPQLMLHSLIYTMPACSTIRNTLFVKVTAQSPGSWLLCTLLSTTRHYQMDAGAGTTLHHPEPASGGGGNTTPHHTKQTLCLGMR